VFSPAYTTFASSFAKPHSQQQQQKAQLCSELEGAVLSFVHFFMLRTFTCDFAAPFSSFNAHQANDGAVREERSSSKRLFPTANLGIKVPRRLFDVLLLFRKFAAFSKGTRVQSNDVRPILKI